MRKYQEENNIFHIVDAGANIGLSTLFFDKFFSGATILAIEPEDNNFECLLRNIELNHLSTTVLPIKKALWTNNTDLLTLGSDFRDGGYWSKTVMQSTGNSFNQVASIGLSSILSQFVPNELIDLLKIDIEGAEATLFESDEFIHLIQGHVKFMCMEIHEEFVDPKKVENVLVASNFEIKHIGQTYFAVNSKLLSL